MSADAAYTISTDKAQLDLDLIHQFLASSYWAKGIPREVVVRSIENSLCFGMFDGARQIGFARLITDYATFAYLADVFIIESLRGRGLATQLLREILRHPDVVRLRRLLLSTKDAHGLYAQFGFTELDNPAEYMTIHRPDIYG